MFNKIAIKWPKESEGLTNKQTKYNKVNHVT